MDLATTADIPAIYEFLFTPGGCMGALAGLVVGYTIMWLIGRKRR